VTFHSTDIDAKIGAVAVDPQWNGVLPSSMQSQNSNEILSFYWQLAQLAQQGFVGALTSPLRLRINDNEMLGLTSTGVLVLGDDQFFNPKTSSAMISGNRVATRLTPSIASVPAAGQVSIRDALFYFISTAEISSVTRCVVSSNMIINDGSSGALVGRISFRLDEPNGGPLAEILVSGNMFQGVVLNNYPPSMNSWNVLNTMIP
jgi:hypothetical protein